MGYFFALLSGIFIGYIGFLFLLFARARRCDGWDNSNMANLLRVLAHLATHPDDFAKMQYPNGKKPFWYLDKDEFSEVVNSRP